MGVGGTALITGASAGLGEAYSRALAARGYDLILVARRRELLESLANELRSRHGVEAEVFTADLTSREELERVALRIEQVDGLAMLINNAGFAVEGFFVDTDIERQMDVVRLHDLASMRLTRAALPQMIARGAGGVICVSSMGGLFSFPANVTYNASKAFLVSFVQSLALELWRTGVRVQALCPGFTRTSFHATIGADVSQVPAGMWMSADAVVEESLQALERGRHGRIVFIPGKRNRRLGWFFLLPRPVVFRASAMLARALEKKMGPGPRD
jgi:uncharacterized protein